MIEKVTVIGLGSLGSHLCENLCKVEKIKELVIVDYDKVDSNNLKLSPYKKEDIGKPKVDALEKMILDGNKETRVVKYNKKFEEGVTKLPKTDLVIDCRDFTYGRKGLIDTRLSISERYLLVDCRKEVVYHSGYGGMYPLDLEKKDIIEAAGFATSLVRRGLIEKMISKQKVYAIELDYLDTLMNYSSDKILKRNDILFDVSSPCIEKFTNLLECVEPIMRMNKLSRVNIYLGNKKYPESKTSFAPNSLKSFNDVVSTLTSMVSSTDYKNYLVLVNDRYKTVELVAEQALA